MQHTISSVERDHNGIPLIYRTSHKGLLSKFFTWCERQDANRMLWLGLSFMGIIGMVLPCTLAAILFLGGGNFTLIVIAAAVNVPVLALNLAAQGTKITIPILFSALLVDFSIVLYSLIYFLTH